MKTEFFESLPSANAADRDENINYSSITKQFYKDIYKIITMADVIIEVLDARDPNNFRNTKIEEEIIANGKKLILLLNKSDLVPKEVVEKWIEYLKNYYPCEAFKASTSKNIIHSKSLYHTATNDQLNSSAHVFGTDSLLNLIKNYSRIDSKSIGYVTVGIIGYPNVGKSSIINSLCRNRNATNTGSTPGVTRSLQEVSLDSKVRLIDSPGVIPLNTRGTTDFDFILRNAVQIGSIKNRYEVVDALLRKSEQHELMKIYKIPPFSSTNEFLELVAKARGKLLKKGVPDYESTALCIINDWVSGKIKYFTTPPPFENLQSNSMNMDSTVTI